MVGSRVQGRKESSGERLPFTDAGLTFMGKTVNSVNLPLIRIFFPATPQPADISGRSSGVSGSFLQSRLYCGMRSHSLFGLAVWKQAAGILIAGGS